MTEQEAFDKWFTDGDNAPYDYEYLIGIWHDAWQAASLAEREACAQLFVDSAQILLGVERLDELTDVAEGCADLIRERGKR